MAKREAETVSSRVNPKKTWIFSKEQLMKFGKSFEKYKITSTLEDGTTATVPDWPTIYFKAGVKTKNGSVTWYLHNGVKVFHIEKFEEMYRQWRSLTDVRDYAENKRLEGYETEGDTQAEIEFREY